MFVGALGYNKQHFVASENHGLRIHNLVFSSRRVERTNSYPRSLDTTPSEMVTPRVKELSGKGKQRAMLGFQKSQLIYYDPNFEGTKLFPRFRRSQPSRFRSMFDLV